MPVKKKILAISGSTRKGSVNLHILRAIAGMYADRAVFTIFNELDQLPHFNPDLDTETPPATITAFRKQIEKAAGILICTPEYVYSLPGSFKNAMEWTVSTILFTHKPTALITAASSGQKAQEALTLLMTTLGVQLPPDGSLLISAPKTKLSIDGEITDENTLQDIRKLMDSFLGILSEN